MLHNLYYFYHTHTHNKLEASQIGVYKSHINKPCEGENYFEITCNNDDIQSINY